MTRLVRKESVSLDTLLAESDAEETDDDTGEATAAESPDAAGTTAAPRRPPARPKAAVMRSGLPHVDQSASGALLPSTPSESAPGSEAAAPGSHLVVSFDKLDKLSGKEASGNVDEAAGEGDSTLETPLTRPPSDAPDLVAGDDDFRDVDPVLEDGADEDGPAADSELLDASVPVEDKARSDAMRRSDPPGSERSSGVSVSGPAGTFRAFSLQVLLGKRGMGDPFDPDLEDELLTEIERAGVDVSRFKAKLSKDFRADERDAALAMLQEDFHTTLHEFEHLCRSAGTRLAHRQRQALEIAARLIRAASALSMLLEKLDGELKDMRGDHSRWVVQLEKALASVHGDQEKRLNIEFNHVQKVIAAVRAGSADVARLLVDVDKRGREMLLNHQALVDQYTGFTGTVHRKLLVSSAAAGVVGAVFGSLLGILLFLWSGGAGS